jgi:hypothetical protein
MAILAVPHVPSLTQARYEEVVRRLTDGKDRLESPSDLPFEGLLVHAAAQSDDGFIIFDIFESKEAFARFGKAVRPIAEEVGIEDPPKAYPAHTFILDSAGAEAAVAALRDLHLGCARRSTMPLVQLRGPRLSSGKV